MSSLCNPDGLELLATLLRQRRVLGLQVCTPMPGLPVGFNNCLLIRSHPISWAVLHYHQASFCSVIIHCGSKHRLLGSCRPGWNGWTGDKNHITPERDRGHSASWGLADGGGSESECFLERGEHSNCVTAERRERRRC